MLLEASPERNAFPFHVISLSPVAVSASVPGGRALTVSVYRFEGGCMYVLSVLATVLAVTSMKQTCAELESIATVRPLVSETSADVQSMSFGNRLVLSEVSAMDQ